MNEHLHSISSDIKSNRLIWAVVINVALTFAQIIGGVISGSLALIADALHNLSDAISLAVIIAGVLILKYEWYFVDTLLTLLIAS